MGRCVVAVESCRLPGLRGCDDWSDDSVRWQDGQKEGARRYLDPRGCDMVDENELTCLLLRGRVVAVVVVVVYADSKLSLPGSPGYAGTGQPVRQPSLPTALHSQSAGSLKARDGCCWTALALIP